MHPDLRRADPQVAIELGVASEGEEGGTA